jgi:alkanesulfonate monooxygenase SsuD/methylene tetrahydromethanopterin reductase-like flavin-dependent oxidoreductase (luciferase family)
VATDGPAKSAHDAAPVGSGSSLGATRIVKTGNLTIRVGKDRVGPVTQLLSTVATSHGGYVAQSNTALDARSPYGEVVLRIPVGRFDAAVAAARKLGDKVVSLTTSADDVTGRYVDLNARKHALERTRQTYLAILARAKTIGETLSVQQRIDDVQQQLDQLHGQLKLLNNQASYSTLTVDVVASGSDIFAATHERQGIDKAWHDSWSRFGRGVNAIVGAIGPIVFAILLIAVVGLIGFGGYRGVRRVVARDQAAS